MFEWHKMLLSGNNSVQDIGGYRTHSDPMQVISGPDYKRKVHFEAPPSVRVPDEMRRFVTWFNDTNPGGKTPLQAAARASLVHLYFVCIHPFEDGNGRIGRALAENSLAQNLDHPSLIALAYTIERKRKVITPHWKATTRLSKLRNGWSISPTRFWKRRTTRLDASISTLRKPDSTSVSGPGSTLVSRKSWTACSGKASMASRAA
jgi:Fic family protein